MSDFEHGCENCYYEFFDSRAYPCSMCIYGEERADEFRPKALMKCYKCRWWNYNFGCMSKHECKYEHYRKENE